MTGPRSIDEVQFEQLRMDARDRLRVATDLAVTAIRSLILINGGAIVALFTLVAQGSGSAFLQRVEPASLVWAFSYFAGGIGAALLATMTGYVSQTQINVQEQVWANALYAHLRGDSAPAIASGRIYLANALLGVGIALALTSALSFGTGAFVALRAAAQAAVIETPNLKRESAAEPQLAKPIEQKK